MYKILFYYSTHVHRCFRNKECNFLSLNAQSLYFFKPAASRYRALNRNTSMNDRMRRSFFDSHRISVNVYFVRLDRPAKGIRSKSTTEEMKSS